MSELIECKFTNCFMCGEDSKCHKAYQKGREEKCDKCNYFISVEEAYKKGANRALELAVNLGYMSMDGWDAVEKKMLKE